MTDWTPLALQYTERAAKDLQRLGAREARRIRAGIVRYAETGHGDVKRLQGAEDFRLRVAGDYRVRFSVVSGELCVMLVLRVGHRREVYR